MKPMTNEKIPATRVPKMIAGMTFIVISLKIQTVAYEPTPIKAACPNDR